MVNATHAIHGLGGIGKTRLAVEYGHHFEDAYSALLMIVADSAENLDSSLAQLTQGVINVGFEEPSDAMEVKIRSAAALTWLRTHPGWLLIIDNVDTREAANKVDALLDKLTGGHVVITSRISDWGVGVERLQLDVLSITDSTDSCWNEAPREGGSRPRIYSTRKLWQ
jgi:hypothetical protein